MCGIAGICDYAGTHAPVSVEALERMVAIQRYRGPDEMGLYVDDHVGLGHARLSIIDLREGSQPIHNEDETLWIVFNGEIFNYLELREGLEAKGHRFATQSDTEVIVHLYEQYGEACVSMLNGQFAFAIRNTATDELFLARDRVGIRPLHYTDRDGQLTFASEIKAIFAAGDVQREVDPIAMDQIFTFWTPLPGRTAFRDVHELPPGHFLKVAAGRLTVTRYWNIPFCTPDEYVHEPTDATCERIHKLLLDAIRIRLRADVPVGTYLSGGLDSSGISALVVKHFDREVKTFGIRFEEDAFDEGDHQSLMVDYLNADHTEMLATNARIGAAFRDVIWHVETPLLRTGPAPLFLLSECVHEHDLKVVLTGEGADEVFGGYNIFREAKVRRFWARQPESQARGALVGRLYPYLFDDPRLRRSVRGFFAKGLDKADDPLFSHLVRWQMTSTLKGLFSPDLTKAIGDYSAYDELKEGLPTDYASWDLLSKAQYLETSLFLSRYLLSSQGDRVAMAHSLEIRLPYLDYRLMDLMSRVPPAAKVRGLNEKSLLKRSFRGILPDAIVARDKHPYRAPISESLLRGEAGVAARELLDEKHIDNAGLFDGAKVTRLVKKLENTERPSEKDGMALAGVLSAQELHSRFVDGFPVVSSHRDAATVFVDKRTGAR